MSAARSGPPPKVAIWLLRHGCPGNNNDALTGDLIERFHEGQTRGWFWRQVLIALAIFVAGEIRRYGPHVCYAIVGTIMIGSLWKTVHDARISLHWWALPWPWSQLVFEVSPTALPALAALPVFAAALVINGTFRWASLLRTGVINLALITLGCYLFDYLQPWLTRPVPNDPYRRVLIIPVAFKVLLFFSTFLAAACLGCSSRCVKSGS
jgi:hypothetical protein